MALLRKAGIPILLLTVSSLLALVVSEAALRLFRPVQYLKPPTPVSPEERCESLYRPSTVPGLSYEMVPRRNGTFEGMQVRTNSLGMRGGEPAPEDPSLFRIVVLGDSFTFGFGVAEEESYPVVLERILNGSPAARQRRYEVLNLGVVGYNTRDEARVLERRALPLDPRAVIIGYVLNDPETDPRQSLHKYFDPPAWWRHFHVLRLLHLGRNWVEVWRTGGGDYIRYLHASEGEKWRSVVTAFRKIREATRDRGTRVVVAIFPIVPREGWAGYPYRDLHVRVSEAARSEGFEVVDLLPVFARYPPRALRLSPEDDHPSRLGHELTARALSEEILSGDDPGGAPDEEVP
jgi:lysophospholipase L1-like esterase